MTSKQTITKIKPYLFNTTKADVDLNGIQKFISYLTENELSLDNQESLVNSAKGKYGQLLLIVTCTFNIQTHSVGKTLNFLMIPHLVHIFTTGLQTFMRVDICRLSIAAVDIIYMHLRSLFVICCGPFLP
jgi:hypothetical protein